MPPPPPLPTERPPSATGRPFTGSATRSDVATRCPPQLVGLCPSQCQALVRVVEAAPQVRRRHQFFIWSQGALQSLLPHQVAVCGAYQRQRRELLYDVFHSVVLSGAVLEVLSDGRTPLMRSLCAAWVEGGGRALRLETAAPIGPAPAAADPVGATAGGTVDPTAAQRERLLDCGVEQLLVHGVSRPQRAEEIENLFVFARPGARITPQHALHLELLLPSLHATWRRVQEHENDLRRPSRPPRHGPADSALSAREREILAGLCEGLSNQRLGERLGISPLTAKNHVQSILRKLGVANRTQAVASALSLQLLPREA